MRSDRIIFASLVALLVGVFGADALAPQKLLSSVSAMPGELKYQVSIRRLASHICGGALISENHVLTAAHCFVGKVNPPYTEGYVFVTGMTRMNYEGELHWAKYVTIHPDYIQGSPDNRWRHDIAVVTLTAPAKSNPLQAPIALPSTNLDRRVTGIVSGWGSLTDDSDGGSYPVALQKSPVTIITLSECQGLGFDTQICGWDGPGTGVCGGDSGGPLAYNNEIVGIVSFSIQCGIGYPDFYTRVFSYKDFIQKAMQRE